VTDRKAIFEAVKTEKDQFDRLDIAVSNAGYGHFSLMEEIPVETQRAQTEKNFFSSFHVIQAVLLFLREQNAGHII
jgi:NADP-dependent 3-hydroxy acid dehydrogenase YdfG